MSTNVSLLPWYCYLYPKWSLAHTLLALWGWRRVCLRTAKLENGNSIFKHDRDDLGFFRQCCWSAWDLHLSATEKEWAAGVAVTTTSTECVAVTRTKLPQPKGSAAPHFSWSLRLSIAKWQTYSVHAVISQPPRQLPEVESSEHFPRATWHSASWSSSSLSFIYLSFACWPSCWMVPGAYLH